MRPNPNFPPWQELARRAKERLRQPQVINGETFICAADLERAVGIDRCTVRNLVRLAPGENMVLTAPCGIRFIRVPRHRGDERPPMYFDEGSVKAYWNRKR